MDLQLFSFTFGHEFSISLKEDELSKSIGSCRVEADVLSSWIKFLEDAWALQSSFTETKEKEAKYVTGFTT